jgi:hypothetical protein
MTKQHLQEFHAAPQRRVTEDLQREGDLTVARRLSEDFLTDEALITEVRQRMESSRVMVEAYGESLTTHDYVTQTLMFLAEVIRERHVKD